MKRKNLSMAALIAAVIMLTSVEALAQRKQIRKLFLL